METEKPEEELAALRLQVKTGAVNLLFHKRAPQYQKHFKSWAKNTAGGKEVSHLDNLVDSLLSATAFVIATGGGTKIVPEEDIKFLQGQVAGIILMQTFIRLYASDTEVKKESVDGYGTLADLLS